MTTFKAGDQVYASTFGSLFGCYAEYKCVPEDSMVAIKPANMTYEEAATVPMGGKTALYFLKKADIQPGQKVLVHGASGSVGTFAVQLAKHFGAEVTGVCSTANVEMVKSLGAGHVIDYTVEDFAQNGETYNVIFDTVGKVTFGHGKRSLTQDGVFLSTYFSPAIIFQALWTSLFGAKKVINGTSPDFKEDLDFLRELIEAGDLVSVIDRGYPLEEIAEAHQYVEEGHKRGNVPITVGTAVVNPARSSVREAATR